MIKKIVIAATLAILGTSAMAQNGAPQIYVGGDIGTTKYKGFDDRETSSGAFAGYNFNQTFALEAGYRVLADFDDTKVTQASLSMIATAPISPGFNVYGRLGYNRLEEKTRVLSVNDTEHDSSAVYGAGLTYDFTPTITGRVEVQKPNSNLTNFSAGVAFKF